MKVVVTGGAGFIGSHLADRLLADGHEVHIVDDLSTGHRRNIPSRAVLHEGSVLDGRLLAAAFADASAVFHQAALGSVPRSLQDPVATHEANATGTLRVLEVARRAGVGKVVCASSSSVYGDTPTLPKVEAMAPRPLSPYAASKLAGEGYARAYHSSFGLRTTSLRYFNVYGPRQDPAGAYAAVVPRFAVAALEGRDLSVHGDGLQSRDFTYVDDVVEANLLAWASHPANGHVLNVGAGATTSVNELAQRIVAFAGSRSRILHGPVRPGDVRDSLAAIDAACGLLGYQPRVTVAEGLRRTVAWYAGPGEART